MFAAAHATLNHQLGVYSFVLPPYVHKVGIWICYIVDFLCMINVACRLDDQPIHWLLLIAFKSDFSCVEESIDLVDVFPDLFSEHHSHGGSFELLSFEVEMTNRIRLLRIFAHTSEDCEIIISLTFE